QAIIANSRRVFLVADHSKFGRNAMVRLGNLSQITALCTDRMPLPAACELLAAREVELYVADAVDSSRPRIAI
ncbi:MAG: DeoR family transcriptional regulator, partial [Alphaproteobacteria bacterium]